MKLHSINYFNTLITPSPDAKATLGPVVPKAGTIGAVQYDLLANAPYEMTSDDILISVLGIRKDVPRDEWPELRAQIFSKGQPCMRLSPLVKSMGWALHHDGEGRVALVDVASVTYRDLYDDEDTRKIHGMRNKRA